MEEAKNVTATLKVVATGEFIDNEASEETVRYFVEQYLEDSGFDVEVELLKEQEAVEPYACEGDMKCGNGCEIVGYIRESDGKIERLANYCPYCGRPVKWD